MRGGFLDHERGLVTAKFADYCVRLPQLLCVSFYNCLVLLDKMLIEVFALCGTILAKVVCGHKFAATLMGRRRQCNLHNFWIKNM